MTLAIQDTQTGRESATEPAKPVRVQRLRKKGWRMPHNTVKVDRSTVYGNPFVVGEDGIGTISECLEAYRAWLHVATGVPNGAGRPLAVQASEVLRGKNLACWCPLDQPCHADVLLELANAPEGERPSSGETDREGTT